MIFQSLSDTQKNKTLNVAILVNASCQMSLVNNDLNTWIVGSHIYKTIFFQNKFNNFLLFQATTSQPIGFGIMVLFYNIIAYSWIFFRQRLNLHWIALKFKILMTSCPTPHDLQSTWPVLLFLTWLRSSNVVVQIQRMVCVYLCPYLQGDTAPLA